MYHGGMPRRAGMYREETEELIGYVADVRDRFDFELKYLDIGGGFVPVRYGASETPPSIDEYAKAISGEILPVCKQRGIAPPTLILEPGRYCFDSACVWLTRVGNVKEDTSMAMRKWVFVDGKPMMATPIRPFMIAFHLLRVTWACRHSLSGWRPSQGDRTRRERPG